MANKQDLKGALTAAQISDGLGLTDLKDREWQILATSALTGQGTRIPPHPSSSLFSSSLRLTIFADGSLTMLIVFPVIRS